MRQFISPRFWLAVAALLAATYGLWYFLVREQPATDAVGPPSVTTLVATGDSTAQRPPEHRINLLNPVYAVQADPGFAMVDGVTNGRLHLVLDGTRTMAVSPGTPGEITCTAVAEIGQCVVAADLLGDAVVWFSLVPGPYGDAVTVPGITELRSQGWTLLANGWEVQRAEQVDRNCTDDTTSLSDFVRQFGGDLSTSTFRVADQQIVKVATSDTCAAQESTTSTTVVTATTIAPVTPQTVPPIDTSVVDTGVPETDSGVG